MESKIESKINVELFGKDLKVTLAGRLDAVKAPDLMEDLKKFSGSTLERIIFYTSELEYISSAGLRVIIFAKQRIGVDSQVFFVGSQEAVLDVIKMSGLDNFLTIIDDM